MGRTVTGMAEIAQTVASIEWIVLGVIVYVKLRQWNKRLSCLHDQMKADVEKWGDGDG